jgi:hypothetical protein
MKLTVIPIEELRHVLGYNPLTGKLWWKQGVSNVVNGKGAGTPHRRGYINIRFRYRVYSAHRIAWALYHNEQPDGEIDHIDGNTGNNCIANLRVVTRRVNMQNAALPKTNTSGVMGVSWHKLRRRWRADIRVRGKQHWLGFFDDKEEAIAARKTAEIEYGFHPNHGRVTPVLC